MATYWKIAAHAAYDMFSKYKYYLFGFLEWKFLKSDCAFSLSLPTCTCTFFVSVPDYQFNVFLLGVLGLTVGCCVGSDYISS